MHRVETNFHGEGNGNKPLIFQETYGWKSFTFVMSRMQCKKKRIFDLEIQSQEQFYGRFFTCTGVEFTYESHGQTFLFALYLDDQPEA